MRHELFMKRTNGRHSQRRDFRDLFFISFLNRISFFFQCQNQIHKLFFFIFQFLYFTDNFSSFTTSILQKTGILLISLFNLLQTRSENRVFLNNFTKILLSHFIFPTQQIPLLHSLNLNKLLRQL